MRRLVQFLRAKSEEILILQRTFHLYAGRGSPDDGDPSSSGGIL